MEAELETDPYSLSLARASLIELWVHPEKEAGLKLVSPGLSKQYVPVAVWLNIRFSPLAGWRSEIRPNVWPDLIREIRTRPLPDPDWEDTIQTWRKRHPEEDGEYSIFTIDTEEGIIEFLAKQTSRQVLDVIQRVIPDD